MEKPQTNVYTMMLIIALIAILIACVMLYMEMASYGPFLQSWKV